MPSARLLFLLLFVVLLFVVLLLGCRPVELRGPEPHGVRVEGQRNEAAAPAVVLPPSTAPIYPTVMTAARWRAETPHTIILFGEFVMALLDAGWTAEQALAMTDAAINCEAPFYDIGTNGPIAGAAIAINLLARGDGGLAWGPGIRIDWHPGIEQRHDLATLGGTVAALTEIRDEAVGYGWAPLSPWSCVQ